jgi:hypothetical protein
LRQKNLMFDPQVVEAVRTMDWQAGGRLGKLTVELSPALYKWVKAALEAVNGTWNRREQGFIFIEDPRPALANIGGGMLKVDDDEFFETPDEISDRMISDVGIPALAEVLEPSAGGGAIVRRIFHHQPDCQVIAVEQNSIRCNELRKISDDFHIVVVRSTFEEYTPSLLFDRVFMNPPFRLAIDHILLAYNLLKSGAKLVSVCPENVFWRDDWKYGYFREFVDGHGRSEKLHQNTFRPNGTSVDTRLVYLDKENA